MFEYKVFIVQDMSGFPGPHVTDIDGQGLYQLEENEEGQREIYGYIPLHIALNDFGRQGWVLDKTVTGIIDGAVLILRRELKS
jgi:hypothetical protein